MVRGLDVFRLTPSEFLSQNEIDAASLVQSAEFNPQQQTKLTWPARPVVARAYLDQLNRTKGIAPARATAVAAALKRADSLKTGRERGAAAILKQLEDLAASVEDDAGSAAPADAVRLRSLASTMKGIAAKLRV
jgi:hypothetical protein